MAIRTYYIYWVETRDLLKVKATSEEGAVLAYIRHEYKDDPEELQKVLKEIEGRPAAIVSYADDMGLVVTAEDMVRDIA